MTERTKVCVKHMRGHDVGSSRNMGIMQKNDVIRRILIIDDNASIHDDYRRVLCPSMNAAALQEIEDGLFGVSTDAASASGQPNFVLETALQGEQALAMVQQAIREGRRYSMAFVDMRMPPGWDGLRTIEELRKVDPTLACVVCSAYSDYTREQITQRLELHEGFLFIRKPFEPEDIRNVAIQMTGAKAA